jgi:hypothetical protein
VRLSALRAGRPLSPERFLVLISVRESPQGHSAAGRIRSVEKSNYFTGNRTRDLPASSMYREVLTSADKFTTLRFTATDAPSVARRIRILPVD